ncbi:MAG TPA: flagellar motor switch protein FliN [Armatimonadetes bacterium]|nr:flagellar motor switch protein FliN [Armatimonadota bacterium]
MVADRQDDGVVARAGISGAAVGDDAVAQIAPLQSASLAVLSGLSLPVQVRIGRATLTVGELLRMGAGTIVTLEQRVDEPVEVLIGEQVVAQGDLVAVGDEMGVRITRIVGGTKGEQ